jgi:CubicO group peptidase (beta-lactamase class C family)
MLRSVLLAAALLAVHPLALARAESELQAVCSAPVARADGWEVASPGAVGFDERLLCAIEGWLDRPGRPNIHALLIARHGKLVYERYFEGSDERWGSPLGLVKFGPEVRHDMRSASKSVVGILAGIAIGRGLLAGVDEPMLRFFPEHADLQSPERQRIRLRDLLTMSAGMRWDESLPYSDPRNSDHAMSRAPDPIRYVLEQPMTAEPGRFYVYNGGATALVAAILGRVSGQPLDLFAKEALFEPLGITDVEWVRYRTGDPIAASGLRLRPRDLAKIGQLVLQEGVWNGRQIVPAAFMREMTSPKINGEGIFFYGYQWWLGRSLAGGREIPWAAALGLGGQRLAVIPELGLVVAMAGLYGSPAQGSILPRTLNRYVLPAVASKP